MGARCRAKLVLKLPFLYPRSPDNKSIPPSFTMLRIPAFLALLAVSSIPANAQEADAFLACADITDRVERVICLEEALESATATQAADTAVVEDTPETEVEDFGTSPGAVTETANVVESGAGERRSFLRLPRLPSLFGGGDDAPESEAVDAEPGEENAVESFGREARVVVNMEGQDELQDEIVELLEANPNMWVLRLASGQVWRQTHPKRLNLREGDAVRIYPSRWGENFRLQTPRLSGFIQVLRVE